jgi:two-component system, response regulator PdtaR
MSSESEQPLRALVCEDQGVTVMAIRKALVRAGYDVVGEAVEGSQAVDLARNLKPDLILMDINMPGSLDGIGAAKAILSEQAVPIIMLTAYNDDNYVNAALDAGACAYLVKPITSEQLLPAVKTAIARFQAQQQLAHEVEDLHDQLETRKLVERAKGILMEQNGLSESEAFRLLQKKSRDKCQPMKQTATDIIKAKEMLS